MDIAYIFSKLGWGYFLFVAGSPVSMPPVWVLVSTFIKKEWDSTASKVSTCSLVSPFCGSEIMVQEV